nr:MAG TPA: hypothetical protein [Caudoviricetes sp.]
MYHKCQEPPLRQQERLWDISEDIHLINENIVSSSEQSRKPEHSFHAGCYFCVLVPMHGASIETYK